MSENNNSRKRQKRANELGSIWPRLFAVGAFAWALYLRRGGANPAQSSSKHDRGSRNNQNLPKSTKSSSRPVLQPEDTAQPETPNTVLTDFQIDSSKFSIPLKELSLVELRQLAGHNLGRIFDESRGGEKWEDAETGFILALHRAGVTVHGIAHAVNRTRNSLSNRIPREINAEYRTAASKSCRKSRRVYDPPVPDRVRIVGRDLPNHKGTTEDIFDLVETKYRDMDRSICPGDKTATRG
eukprot:454846_1